MEGVRSYVATLDLHVGRWIVLAGAAVAIAAFVYEHFHRDADLYLSVERGIVLGGLTMIALGVGERFWRNKKVTDAGMSASGPTVSFGDEITDAVSKLNERMNDHVAAINERLLDLERSEFKGGGALPDEEE